MNKNRGNEDDALLLRFGERLRHLRTSKGLTQEEVAALAGFSRSYYTEIETGKRNISLLNFYRLARCLGVRVSDLLDNASEG